jgi:hypothetical protein
MPKKRFKAEQTVVLLRQIELLMSQGKAAPVACREAAELGDECPQRGNPLQLEGNQRRHRAMA